MAVNLSVKAVPEALAAELRARAARNHRSLQRELLAILHQAVGSSVPARAATEDIPQRMTIDEIVERAKALCPNGTPSSLQIIREQRDLRSGKRDRGAAESPAA